MTLYIWLTLCAPELPVGFRFRRGKSATKFPAPVPDRWKHEPSHSEQLCVWVRALMLLLFAQSCFCVNCFASFLSPGVIHPRNEQSNSATLAKGLVLRCVYLAFVFRTVRQGSWGLGSSSDAGEGVFVLMSAVSRAVASNADDGSRPVPGWSWEMHMVNWDFDVRAGCLPKG